MAWASPSHRLQHSRNKQPGISGGKHFIYNKKEYKIHQPSTKKAQSRYYNCGGKKHSTALNLTQQFQQYNDTELDSHP